MDVELGFPDGSSLCGEARVSVSSSSASTPLGDFREFASPYISHSGVAFLETDFLDDEWASEEGWAKIRENYPVVPHPDGSGGDVIRLSKVLVDQIRPGMHIPAGDWTMTLDAVSGDLMEVGERMEQLIDLEATWIPQYSGSLFYVTRADTVPGCRGQEIALHLIAHTLAVLSTSLSDYAMVHARPGPCYETRTHEGDEVEDGTDGVTADRLAGHYEKLGFVRTEMATEECILLELSLNEFVLPARYWPDW